MASGQIPCPNWQTNRHSVPDPGRFRPKLPCGYFDNLPRDMWIIRTKDSFQLLIRHAECQPSNGTVRRVLRPDDETRFAVAYSFAPDRELHSMLVRSPGVFGLFDTDLNVPQEKIYNKHGEVTLQHDGRDSTGKHWIKCFSVSYPHSSKSPLLH